MKKSTYLLLLLLVVVTSKVRANIIMPENILTMKVQLTNLEEFPDMAIVAFDNGAIPSTNKYSIVKEEALVVSQKPKTAILKMSHATGKRAMYYILKKDYLKKVGIDSINWETDKNVQRLNVETGSGLALSDVYSDIQV